ncbi:hypothetical protein J5N97_004869 [Dioscorea zingiberensis]|uniref:Translation initiation factor IF2/IF5 domain-containing protein n=1 Tax=Dioscorea zingiberensis TaxID=325984 RepID=A0A9D5D966_9LILI|nr:hypothetical protein J5N97_004869 [Dioscorea zingiberensis]
MCVHRQVFRTASGCIVLAGPFRLLIFCPTSPSRKRSFGFLELPEWYKMPKMITKIEGRGNGIKTNIVNMVDIAKALARPASYTTKFFGCELGAQSKFDEKSGVSLVNGAHDTAKLAGLLENFIKKYVQCYGCGNPETEITITKNQMLTLKCAACGFVSDVDMRDKLTTFILKNPPEQKKGGKDKKTMRRAEKERL